MASVIHRTTNEYRDSVNTPDFLDPPWLINPDVSALSAVPRKYWKVVGNTVVEMTTAEKKNVDKVSEFEQQAFFDDFLGEIPPRWTPNVSGALSTVGLVSPGGEGGVVSFKSDSVSGSFASQFTTKCQYEIDNIVMIRYRIREITTGNQKVSVGVYINNNNFIAFQRQNAQNWLCNCTSAGVSTVVDSLAAGDSAWHVFKIKASATQVLFIIDGLTVGTISTNIPLAQQELLTRIDTLSGAASIREFQLDAVEVRTDRA